MKIFLLILVLFFVACVSTKYTAKTDAGNFEKLQAGKTYVFFHGKNQSTEMEIVSIEKDSIIGLKHNTRIAVAKNTISEVDQKNTAGTVILAGSAGRTVVLVGVLVAEFLNGAAKVGN